MMDNGGHKPNILLLASHAIAEYDDLRMFTDLGYDVFCPGGYADPRSGIEGMRPGVPNAKVHGDLIAACDRVRAERGDPGAAIDWAKAAIPDEVLDWADVIICHHFVDRWIVPQWPRLQGKRVIWRTCGQSSPDLEAVMGHLRRLGLQIVRYSPKEAAMPYYAGADALIRFGKYPADYGPWTGEQAVVLNIAQHDARPHGRDMALSWVFWLAATKGLPAVFAGPNSELVGGLGALTYDEMRAWLCKARVYLYTGTVAAPYTLGLIEAMLTGIPVLSIGPRAWNGPDPLFEGHEIAGDWTNELDQAARRLSDYLADPGFAYVAGESDRQAAIDLFDVAKVGPQWQEFLS